jgi:tyrosyl-tRNA synthetase
MTLSEELAWRGFVNQTTFSDLKQLDNTQWTFYHGFDASADSQAVGNLAAMMFDKVFLRHGHKAIVLAGGATSLLGDPGGKDSERPMQSEETIAHNVACAEAELKRIFAGHEFTMVNNIDWFKTMNVLHFMRDVGKHFSMTPLVQRDYIAKRMGEGGAGISYTEFSYTLLQGYDFLHLNQKYGVNLQLAGADQWGNSISGVDLIRRATGNEAHIMTLPLIINKATGKKFGKSEAGAVWLNAAKTTPTQFYRFWVNIDDEGVEGYLKIFTELDKPAVDEIMAQHRQNPKARFAQKRLAQEVTTIVHSAKETEIAKVVTAYLTAQTPLTDASEEQLAALRKEIPAATAEPGDDMLDVLVATGLVSSKSEARRLLMGNAIAINGQKTAKTHLESDDFQNGRLLLRKGKAFKDSALIERK